MKKNYSLCHSLIGVWFFINAAAAADPTSSTVISSDSRKDEKHEIKDSNKDALDDKLLYVGAHLSLGITDHGDVNYRADIEIDSEHLSKSNALDNSYLPSWARPDRETMTIGYLQSKNAWAVTVGIISYYDIYQHFGFCDQSYCGYADANGSALLVSKKEGLYWSDMWWTKVHVQMEVGIELLGLLGGNGDDRRELQGLNVVGGISFGF